MMERILLKSKSICMPCASREKREPSVIPFVAMISASMALEKFSGFYSTLSTRPFIMPRKIVWADVTKPKSFEPWSNVSLK